MRIPSSLSFMGMYVSAKEVFGAEMTAEFLLERVRSYGWKGTVARLAQLAAYIQHPLRTDEEVRLRTVDPVLLITGDNSTRAIREHAREFIRVNRKNMLIAHEEVISYLQHLVLVEGGENDDTPTDQELSFWMLGANGFLGKWAEPDKRKLTFDEEMIAVQTHGRTFNQTPNWGAVAVRSHDLFRSVRAAEGEDAAEAWMRTQLEVFGASFVEYYNLILVTLLGKIGAAGDRNEVPVVTVDYWKPTGADPKWVEERLDAIATTREQAIEAILREPNARSADGLLHSPTLLRRKPLLKAEEGWLITSRAAVRTQLHSGPWGAYLEKSKASFGDDVGFLRWSSAFGDAFERYGADLATQASSSRQFRSNWKVIRPSKPGASDEVEDVILIEDDQAVFFSLKSTMLPEGAVHRARSRSAVLDWFERFFFSTKKGFKGAVLKLSANIDEVRNGDFEKLGVGRSLKILPVIITYDDLGEDTFLYAAIRRRCKELGLLTQPGVHPLTIGSIEELEFLMEAAAQGRSVVGMLRKRRPNGPWFDRRLDQQLGSLERKVHQGMIAKRFDELFTGVV